MGFLSAPQPGPVGYGTAAPLGPKAAGREGWAVWDGWDLFGQNKAGGVRMGMGMSCPKEKSRAWSGHYPGSATMPGTRLGAGAGSWAQDRADGDSAVLLGPRALRSPQPLHCNPILSLWMRRPRVPVFTQGGSLLAGDVVPRKEEGWGGLMIGPGAPRLPCQCQHLPSPTCANMGLSGSWHGEHRARRGPRV